MKVYGITGWKNAGKTGLMERLVAEITARGLTVSTLKHAHHSFDVDHPGKDSHRHREAGARQVLVSSGARWALMSELRGAPEPPLSDLLARLDPVDLVLIEGWKRDRHPKIEAWRAETGHPLIAPGDPTISAVASDGPLETDRTLLDLDDTGAIADFILREVGLDREPRLPDPRQTAFDRVMVVDWSGGKDTGAAPRKDAIWIGEHAAAGEAEPLYQRNRVVAQNTLVERLRTSLDAGERVLIGFDFAFAYPAGFATALTDSTREIVGTPDPFAVWEWLAHHVRDLENGSDRAEVAAALNRLFAPRPGPFYFNPFQRTRPLPDLPNTKPTDGPFPEQRTCDAANPGAQSAWKLGGVGSVGSQALMGMPVLWHLRQTFGTDICVWPFEAPTASIVVCEVFPSLIAPALAAYARQGEVLDATQVRALSTALFHVTDAELGHLLDAPATEEGWILGTGMADVLTDALSRASAP
ncbi:MAG: molybdopterin-guanine dinucleotide biosynthesis protein B [Shimia sp.]